MVGSNLHVVSFSEIVKKKKDENTFKNDITCK